MVSLRLHHNNVITQNCLRSGFNDQKAWHTPDGQTHGWTNIKFWGSSTQKALKGNDNILKHHTFFVIISPPPAWKISCCIAFEVLDFKKLWILLKRSSEKKHTFCGMMEFNCVAVHRYNGNYRAIQLHDEVELDGNVVIRDLLHHLRQIITNMLFHKYSLSVHELDKKSNPS